MKIVLLSVFLTALAVLMLGVKALFVKGGKFPSGHISENAAMRRKGISCVHSQAKQIQKPL